MFVGCVCEYVCCLFLVVVMIFLAVSMMGFILRGGLEKFSKASSAFFLLLERAWGASARIQVL